MINQAKLSYMRLFKYTHTKYYESIRIGTLRSYESKEGLKDGQNDPDEGKSTIIVNMNNKSIYGGSKEAGMINSWMPNLIHQENTGGIHFGNVQLISKKEFPNCYVFCLSHEEAPSIHTLNSIDPENDACLEMAIKDIEGFANKVSEVICKRSKGKILEAFPECGPVHYHDRTHERDFPKLTDLPEILKNPVFLKPKKYLAQKEFRIAFNLKFLDDIPINIEPFIIEDHEVTKYLKKLLVLN